MATVGPPPHRTATVVHGARTPIRHIVFIVKENRSYDNLYGLFPGGDGTRTGRTADGRVVPLTRLPDVQTDLQHNHHAAVTDIAGGAMNGFSAMPDKNGRPTMLAYTTAFPGELPAYWGWAKHYELLDHTFSSGDTSSFPNHLYTVSATAAGAVDGPNFGVENWGCDGPAHLSVPVIRHNELVTVPAVLCDRLDRRAARPPRHPVERVRAARERPRLRLGGLRRGQADPRVERLRPPRPAAGLDAQRPGPGLPGRGHLDRAAVQPQRPPRRHVALRRRGLDGRARQPDHAHARLAAHGDRAHLGRVGRLLRPRRPADSPTASAWACACRWS